ncbi:MAG: hypothetical protein ACQUYJ_12665, partial [Ferruginibacter sp.]
MKEIVILLVTFLGICKGFAQSPAGDIAPDSLLNATKKTITDSLLTKEKATVKLFPNPVKNKAVLEVNGFEPGLIQVQIIDMGGKKLRNDQRLLTSGNETLALMFS